MHLNANQQGGAVVSFPANLRGQGAGPREDGYSARRWLLGGPSLMIEDHRAAHRRPHQPLFGDDFSGLPTSWARWAGSMWIVPYTVTSFGFTSTAGSTASTPPTRSPMSRQPASQRDRPRGTPGEPVPGDPATRSAATTCSCRATNRAAGRRGQRGQRGQQPQQLPDGASWPCAWPTCRAVTACSSTCPPGTHANSGSPAGAAQKGLAGKLWRAIRDDTSRSFAQRYPGTVTPDAPG